MQVFSESDLKSGEGMLTTVWGPCMWHYLHTMSFNYPVNPNKNVKKWYRDFMVSLTHVLPCKHCRDNLTQTYKTFPLTQSDLASRASFSKYVYELHNKVNDMLNKKHTLTYEEVRERYEHFRARCEYKPIVEKGCTQPLLGKKCKSVISIVPQSKECPTIHIHKSTLRKKKMGNPSKKYNKNVL
jgi:hypothetical protein